MRKFLTHAAIWAKTGFAVFVFWSTITSMLQNRDVATLVVIGTLSCFYLPFVALMLLRSRKGDLAARGARASSLGYLSNAWVLLMCLAPFSAIASIPGAPVVIAVSAGLAYMARRRYRQIEKGDYVETLLRRQSNIPLGIFVKQTIDTAKASAR